MPEITKLSVARQWLDTASEDLALAVRSGAPPPLYSGGVYNCEQAAEKALKGFLLLHDTRFEKTHDVRKLLQLCARIDATFSALRHDAALLTPYADKYRYPAPVPTKPNKAEYRDALAAAERVYRFVLAKHPELDPEKT